MTPDDLIRQLRKVKHHTWVNSALVLSCLWLLLVVVYFQVQYARRTLELNRRLLDVELRLDEVDERSRSAGQIPDRVRNLPPIPEDSLPERIVLPLAEVRRVGARVVAVARGRYGPHEVKVSIELPWSETGQIRFVRSGEESDTFAQLLSDATGVPARPKMRDVVALSAVLVDGRLEEAERSTAMWKATRDSPYCELLVEFNGPEKVIQLLEKDADFRTTIVRTFAR